MAKLYNRIGAPALVDLKVSVDLENASTEQGSAISRVYPKSTMDLFAGDQLVLVGRYRQPGDAKITLSGKVDGSEQTFHFPGKFIDKSLDDSQSFIEKLWAVRRVGEIIDEIDLHGQNQELVNELVALATKHGILTPYTSFLADETANVRDLASNQARAGVELKLLEAESGGFAFGQRRYKNELQQSDRAPGPGYAAGSGTLGGMGGAVPTDSESLSRKASMPGAGGMAGRRGARFGSSGSAAPATNPSPGNYDAPQPVVNSVLNVGTKTFFQRNNRWEDASLSEEQLKNIQQIERYQRRVLRPQPEVRQGGGQVLRHRGEGGRGPGRPGLRVLKAVVAVIVGCAELATKTFALRRTVIASAGTPVIVVIVGCAELATKTFALRRTVIASAGTPVIVVIVGCAELATKTFALRRTVIASWRTRPPGNK